MNKKIFKDVLKTIFNDRRFEDTEELTNKIKGYLRINLVDINKVDVSVMDLADSNKEIPNDIDYLLSCTITDLEQDENYDFDLYYAKTRTNGYYITEYIVQ